MSKDEITPVIDHLGQLKAMLESCEIEFELYEEADATIIELYNGTRFIFGEDDMLLEIEY